MKARIVDATLREGCQAPGVHFNIDQCVAIARMLDALGVDMIECSHPYRSELERLRLEALVRLGLRAPLIAHARARNEDILAVRDSGTPWVGIFCGINEISRNSRLSGRSSESVLDLVRRSVAYAKSLGLHVRYTVEDGSRTPLDLAIEALEAAVSEGADRVCYADTLGAMTPSNFGSSIRTIRSTLPCVDIEVHVHDDRGFAMSNAWMALESGANWVSASVNGIGERCGITDLASLLANLDLSGERAIEQADLLQRLSRYVAAITRSQPDVRRPVVGRNAFTHTAPLHAKAVGVMPSSYSVFDASRLGRALKVARKPLGADIDSCSVLPQVISATELRYHRAGPGSRYVMVDERFVADARQYCIVRDIPEVVEPPAPHVDPHRHDCDSLFLFVGREEGLKGLRVEVMLEGATRTLESPASLFVPAGTLHSYRILNGCGLFLNHVLAGSYNDSLL